MKTAISHVPSQQSPSKPSLRVSTIIVAFGFSLTLSGCQDAPTIEDAREAYRNGDYAFGVELLSNLIKASDDPEIVAERAYGYMQLGDLESALADYDVAIQRIMTLNAAQDEQQLAYLYFSRGIAHERLDSHEFAIADYEAAISTDSTCPHVRNNLAWVFATCPEGQFQNPDLAVKLAEQELQIMPDHPIVLDTLAATYAAIGDFDQAIQTEQKAIALIDDQAAKERFLARLKIYREGKSFIDE